MDKFRGEPAKERKMAVMARDLFVIPGGFDYRKQVQEYFADREGDRLDAIKSLIDDSPLDDRAKDEMKNAIDHMRNEGLTYGNNIDDAVYSVKQSIYNSIIDHNMRTGDAGLKAEADALFINIRDELAEMLKTLRSESEI